MLMMPSLRCRCVFKINQGRVMVTLLSSLKSLTPHQQSDDHFIFFWYYTVCVCVFAFVREGVILQEPCSIFTETGPLNDFLLTVYVGQGAWPGSPQNLPISASPVMGLQVCPTESSFLVWILRIKSGPCVCKERTVVSEPSPRPQIHIKNHP